MYNITLVCTAHTEIGNCNSEELYKIIESINPDVVFEELSINLFNRFYNENQLIDESLEVKCLKRYLQNHNIKHIPVDIDITSNLTNSDIDYMIKTFKKYDAFKKLESEQNFLTEHYGFAYLNSNKCSELFDRIKNAERSLMEFGFNKNLLSHFYKLFHEEHDNRENEILHKIYVYSNENLYNRAVLLIGSAHRNSMIKKIKDYKRNGKLRLNWTIYNAQRQADK
jgi:hypothetical protein